MERIVGNTGAGIPVCDETIPVEQEERVRLDLARELRVDRRLRLCDGLLQLRERPLFRPERFDEPVVDELRVDFPVADPEFVDFAVMREKHHAAVDLPPERMCVLVLDRVLLRRVADVGYQGQGWTADPSEPPDRLVVLRVRGGFGPTACVELPLLPDAGDSPASRMAGESPASGRRGSSTHAVGPKPPRTRSTTRRSGGLLGSAVHPWPWSPTSATRLRRTRSRTSTHTPSGGRSTVV